MLHNTSYCVIWTLLQLCTFTCLFITKWLAWLIWSWVLWSGDTNSVIQNTMQNLDKVLKNWKFWRVPTTVEFYMFCWNFAQTSYYPVSTNGLSWFFLFCLDLVLFAKIKTDLVSTHSKKLDLSMTQHLNKTKTIPNTFL